MLAVTEVNDRQCGRQLHPEALAQIMATNLWVSYNLVRTSLSENVTRVDDIRAVN